ncbi:glycosyltransferase [Hymenobacter properus]|uniref:Glycosyltransferase n=1 Tax=Hymenobacter properus TaxID=2791026 RepID=A0A931BL86_9BACT|nr:glycosyltransferase [Hymenobacter properus]MBF9144248.1 glycosyltransferase [Hymenobacter properus]MBR7723066.1 glycosyltransferase [Microvirga sp. SRT04]
MMGAVGAGLLVLPALYAGVMGWLRGGWKASLNEELEIKSEKLGTPPANPACSEAPIFSILIAARNEAQNLPQLLRDLAAQTLPAAQFEVLIADDHSTDATAELVTAAAEVSAFPLRLITLPTGATGKKAALQAALQAARAPWLVCTDADCRLGPGWLAAYAALIAQNPNANFISGPVLLTGPDTLFARLMGLEFAGLVGVGGACLARQWPTMCNGANLAYRRAAFAAVGGFTDNAHLASGDDEFLLHKIHAAFPGTTHFLLDAAAIVRTAAPPTLRALLRQRVRWASKWRHYQSLASRQLALLVLGANVALAAGVGAGLAWPALWLWVLAAWGLKLGADAWFMAPVLRFLGRRRWLGLLPLLQLLYAPYALGVGLAGLRGGYQWKGRAVS